ncbi:MAG TPA: hypothetical protein VGG77_12175 [Roseiarcus sp.]|jgi:hypothetical protein
MSDSRHHLAVRVVFVEVPQAGSPQPLKWAKPPAYPHQHREVWRPRTKPPSKAESLRRLLDYFNRQDQIVREMTKPNGALAWRGGLMVVDHDITPVCITSGFVVR